MPNSSGLLGALAIERGRWGLEMGNAWLWLFIWLPLVVGSFAVIEGYALRHSERQWTLSRCCAWLGTKFPLSIAVFGMLFGGLLVHFFWHFCPDFTRSQGLLTLPHISLQGIFVTPVEAHDYKRPDLNQWYGSLQRPGMHGLYGASGGNSCCSLQDCHTTEAELRDGEWWARLGKPYDHHVDGQEVRDWELEDWVKVPDDKIVRGPNGNAIRNEAGEPVICHNTVWKNERLDPASVTVFCFVPGEQS